MTASDPIVDTPRTRNEYPLPVDVTQRLLNAQLTGADAVLGAAAEEAVRQALSPAG